MLTSCIAGDIKNAAEYLDSDTWTEVQECEDNQLAMQLTECYALGNFLLAENFCNTIMNLFIAKAKSIYDKFQNLYGTGAANTEHIWKTTNASSPLRRMMLDLHIAGYAQYEDDEIGCSLPLQIFYRDLAVTAMGAYHEYDENHEVLKYPWEGDVCRYHMHQGKPSGFSCTRQAPR